MEDLGLPPVTETTQSPTLPVISKNESDAIESFLKEMADLDLMTDVSLKKMSVEAWETIRFSPMSDYEIDDKIYREMLGENVPIKVVSSTSELLQKESNHADAFFERIENDFPNLSIENLISLREKLTISLITIRLQLDYRDETDGIPDEFLIMTRTKTVAFRQKVNEELLKRGVTNL